MKEAFREKKRALDGMELPIECLYRISRKSERNMMEGAPHFHDYIELIYGLNCDVTAWIAGKTVKFQNGDFLIINSNASHSFCHNLDFNDYICIKFLPQVVYFSENSFYDIKYVTPFLQSNILPYHFFDKSTVQGTPIPKSVIDIQNEWTKKDFGYEVSLKNELLAIFLWTIRYNYKNKSTDEIFSSVSNESIRVINSSLEYISANLATVCEAQAANEANISYSYYSRLFKRVVGKNFNEYLQNAKINAAERLLISTDMSVTEIALATGFSTTSHFIERFKKFRNVTPKQFKNRCRKESAQTDLK